MLFSLVLAALPLAFGSPIEKRFTNQVIRSYRTGSCLTLQGGVQIVDGSLLRVGDCATATRWDISPGSGSVIVSGTNFALDAGLNPHNNVPAKVWQSYPGAPQQTWYLTQDNRIAITGGNQCLDEGDNGPQTYQCTTGNTNQIWYVYTYTPGSSVSSSMSQSSTSSSASSTPTGPAKGNTLRWKSDSSLCATVQGAPANGVEVNLQTCTNNNAAQTFTLSNSNLIQLAGTNFCLDAGVNPSNGVQMKIWQCYPGLSQQTWMFYNGVGSGSTGLVKTANNQCLDVNNQGNRQIQTWTCSQPDPQQQFVVY